MTEPTIRIALLGPIRAWRFGEEVPLRGVSARTVLASLALRVGAVMSVDELSEALWEEDPPVGATANLQSIISRLRRGLGSEVLETVSPGYRLVPDCVSTDICELEVVLSNSATSQPPDAVGSARFAPNEWDAEPLADVAETAWFLPDRARLAELRLAARDRHNQQLMAAGRLDEALIGLRGATAEVPLRESTQRLLAEALHRLGRDAEALRVINGFRHALIEQTGLDPSPALHELEQRVLAGNPSQRSRGSGTGSYASNWLPPDTPFVGRDRALEALRDLSDRHRLVTVVGTGGIGKSRLVMELLRMSDLGSVVVVLLAPVDAQGSVEAAVAAELGLEATTAPMLDAIAERLRPNATLVVLDNCEHQFPEVQDMVDGLLRRVEDVRIVATSRQRLGLAEEQLLRLEPLELPPEADQDAPAVQLFLDRVSRAAPDLDLETADVALLSDICRLLDGLPLALELAAARVHLLGLAELRAQLVRGQASAEGAKQTIDGTVAWSLALLSAEARQLFGEASVFPASFRTEAVGAVSTLVDPATALAELVDASMIQVLGDSSHRFYRILAPIRQVGRAETSEEVVEAYLSWVAGLGAQANDLFLAWQASSASELLSSHHDDFRHALTVMAGRDEERFGRLAADLTYALARQPKPELVGLILENSPDTPDGLVARVDLEWLAGLPERCIEHAERLLGLVDDDDPRVPRALGATCPAYSFLGRPDRMVDSAQQAVAHPASTDHGRISAIGLWALGERYSGNPERAREILAENEDLLERRPTAFIPFVRAEIAAATDPDEALAWLEKGSQQARRDSDLLLARMIEVAQLAMLVRGDQHQEASKLARDLIPELLTVGMLPQAWMALRHIAALLTSLGEYAMARLILDSARVSSQATELVGEAVAEEEALLRRIRSELVQESAAIAAVGEALSAGELWPNVNLLLERRGEPRADG